MWCPDFEPRLLRALQHPPDGTLRGYETAPDPPSSSSQNVSGLNTRHVSHMVETSADVLIREAVKRKSILRTRRPSCVFFLCERPLGRPMKTLTFRHPRLTAAHTTRHSETPNAVQWTFCEMIFLHWCKNKYIIITRLNVPSCPCRRCSFSMTPSRPANAVHPSPPRLIDGADDSSS